MGGLTSLRKSWSPGVGEDGDAPGLLGQVEDDGPRCEWERCRYHRIEHVKGQHQ